MVQDFLVPRRKFCTSTCVAWMGNKKTLRKNSSTANVSTTMFPHLLWPLQKINWQLKSTKKPFDWYATGKIFHWLKNIIDTLVPETFWVLRETLHAHGPYSSFLIYCLKTMLWV